MIKENLCFKQLRMNYLKQPKKKRKRTPEISNKLYQGRCGFKCTRTIDYRLARVFLKNLKHHSQPTLVSPYHQFKLSKYLTVASLYTNFYVKEH